MLTHAHEYQFTIVSPWMFRHEKGGEDARGRWEMLETR